MVSLSQQQQRTVGFLKPDVIDRKTELMDLIKSNIQWKVTFEQELILSLGEAKVLYPLDVEAKWLSSHPIYVFILEGNNVIQHWLDFVGPKDPEEAKQVSLQSLRACFGLDLIYNVCHASGSDKEAQQDLIWLQGLVVDDLSIQLDPSSLFSSEQSNKKSQPSSKPSKLKKPTSVAASKIGVTSATTTSAVSSATSKHLSATSSNSSAASCSSSEAKKKSTSKQSMTIPRPKSSLGSRPTTPSGTPSKQGTAKTLKSPAITTKKSVAPKAQALSKGRKETKTSRIGARSESTTKQSPDSVPSMGPSFNKRLSNTRGISKNTPGVSVLTGRTRKNSRLEKRKDMMTVPPAVAKDDPTTLRQSDEIKKNGITTDETSNILTESSILESRDDDLSNSITNYGNKNNNNNAPYATESVNTLTSASTSCSQHTRDSDHDAEVAAATSSSAGQLMMNPNINHAIRVDSPSDLMDRRRSSSSFSPASVASSLTRPETPEVDNLRQRFESLAKSPTGQTTIGTTPSKRNSSITPEIASRIKDLKPKDPAGSRVKSMVEFFMDEKLHKWEF